MVMAYLPHRRGRYRSRAVPNRLVALHLNNSIVDVMGNPMTNASSSFSTSPTKFNAYTLTNGGAGTTSGNNDFILTHHSVRGWVYITGSGLANNSEYPIWRLSSGSTSVSGSIYKPGSYALMRPRFRGLIGSFYEASAGTIDALSSPGWRYMEWGLYFSSPTSFMDFNINGAVIGSASTTAAGFLPTTGRSLKFSVAAYSGAIYLSDFEYYSVYTSGTPASTPTATFRDTA